MTEADAALRRTRATLSEAEVEALIGGIADGRLPAERGLKPRAPVERHVFGAAAPQLAGELGALGILHERFARSLRRAFLPLLRYQPRVVLSGIESRAYDDYVAGQRSTLVCFNIVRVEPLRGNVLVALQPDLVSALVDGFFGGKGRAAGRSHGDFTPTEERVIQRLVESMCIGLARAWEEVAQLRFTFTGTESNAQLAIFLEQDDAVLVCSLEVELAEQSTTLDVLYPLQLLKPVLPALRSKVQAERVEASADWRDRLGQAAMEILIPIRSVLAEPVVTVGELSRLSAGDVLPIQVGEDIRVMIARTLFATGTLGDVRGGAAIQLNRLAAPRPAAHD